MAMILALLLVFAAQPEPDTCVYWCAIGTGRLIECPPPEPCAAPSLTTVYPWGTLSTCHAALPDASDPELWGNFAIGIEVCGSEADGGIFADGFESGDTEAWSS